MLIGGEAGVGKSRLVNEFAERSRQAGARVLAGGCLELGADGLPFAPFTSVLRELVRDLGADGVAGLLPAGARPGNWPGCCRSSASPPGRTTRVPPGRGSSSRC